MSYCKEEGKDKIIFVTKEDHDVPSTSSVKVLEEDEDDQPGLLLPNGDINWDCPCLGGMATGPCGVQFRDAFSCFHYSKEEAKGSDCYEQFSKMQDCMVQYPEVYPRKDDDDTDEGIDDLNLGSLDIIRDDDDKKESPETKDSTETSETKQSTNIPESQVSAESANIETVKPRENENLAQSDELETIISDTTNEKASNSETGKNSESKTAKDDKIEIEVNHNTKESVRNASVQMH